MSVRRLCVIGIGNPGRRYEETRHNIGFAVVDALADRHGGGFRERDEAASCTVRVAGAKVLLIKPLTYVNLTGKIVPRLLGEIDDPKADLMVVLDEMDLPLGRLRLRTRGRSGGHRGLESVIAAVGSVFPRLRVGIGRGDAATAHVLGRFGPEERETADRAVGRAADALDCWIEMGMDKAMNDFNKADA